MKKVNLMNNTNGDQSKVKLRKQISARMGIGLALGIALGAALDNIALGLVVGIVVGGIGWMWSKKRE